jgi:adenylyltransferase/sulfurtransferase
VDDLVEQYLALKPHLFNEQGAAPVRQPVREDNIKDLQGLDTPSARRRPPAADPQHCRRKPISENDAAKPSHEEILRYCAIPADPRGGLDGQRKLKAASILVIGTGGLGSPVALPGGVASGASGWSITMWSIPPTCSAR